MLEKDGNFSIKSGALSLRAKQSNLFHSKEIAFYITLYMHHIIFLSIFCILQQVVNK